MNRVIDWATVFEERWPEAGISEETLERLRLDLQRPISAEEIRQANIGLTEHANVGMDPATWRIPSQPLPASYLSLLRWSNGGEFRNGDRWFQFLPAAHALHGVRATLLMYELPDYMPGALPIAFDGGGGIYLFDMRASPTDGEYPVVWSHATNLGWQSDDYIVVGKTLIETCRGTTVPTSIWTPSK